MNITVIGIGNLGLCTALCLSEAGFNVVGIDKSKDYIKSLNRKKFKSYEPQVNELLQNATEFTADTSLDQGLKYSNIIFILVQTPNGGSNKFYDHSILSDLLVKINNLKPTGKHFVICSTVMPKYINEVATFLLRDCKDYTISYNPEFVAQGCIIHDFRHPDIILIGEGSKEAGDLIESIHLKVVKNTPKICRMSVLEAEITKISLNGFLTTKITYANLIGDVCGKHGCDPTKVLSAIGSDSRVGNKCFKYGFSVGGPCLYRDTLALDKCITDIGIQSDLIKAVKKSNDDHIKFQAETLLKYNNDTSFDNICYKENSKVPIIIESPKLKIAKILVENGRKVLIKDERQLIEEVQKEYGNLFEYEITG